MMDDSERTSHDPVDAGDAPVTAWLRRLESGDVEAAQPLWQHFCTRVIAIARKRLPPQIRTGYDEDDVAASAFHRHLRE